MLFLFYVPKKLTSHKVLTKIEQIVSEKTHLPINIQGLKVKTYFNLNFDIYIEELFVQKNLDKPLSIQKMAYKANLCHLRHASLKADTINADIQTLKKYIQNSQTKPLQKLNLKYFPIININQLNLDISKDTYITIKNINSVKRHKGINTTLFAQIYTPYSKYPIVLGKTGSILYSDKNVYFDNMVIELQNSKLIVTGNLNNLSLKGEKLPIEELENNFIYFYKLKHPHKKNFIENFSNFKGILNLDISYKDGKFEGKAIAKDLKANFSTYKIPIYLPLTEFIFKNRSIKAKTKGYIGDELAETDFYLDGLATKALDVKGNIWTKLPNKFVKKYYPILKITNYVNVHIKYHNHNNGHTDVFYEMTLPKGSNIISSYGNLNNNDKIRKLIMHTHKYGNPIQIKNFEYLIYHNSIWQKLFTAGGLINKYNNKYKLEKIYLKTNATIPIAYIQSFIKNILTNGTFSAHLVYDNITKKLTGQIDLYNVSHNDYLFLKETSINVVKDTINLQSNGTFYNAPITFNANIKNDFNEQILVKNLDINLKSFLMRKGKISPVLNTNSNHLHHSNILSHLTVERGKLNIDRIYNTKFDVRNVNIYGTLKDEIAYITIPQAEYAEGLLSGKGQYNICNHSSKIHFYASDINSDIVATNFFKLPNQIQGKAFATLYLTTKNKLNDIHAKATFAITDGFLPKIGSQEFIIKNSKSKLKNKINNMKITLSQITNIDFSKPNIFYSNLYGSFYMDNENVHNVRIFSKSDFLSMFIEGCYDIDLQDGELFIWGKRNKTKTKNIRILKIPFNWLYRLFFKPETTLLLYEDKINLIPQIKTKTGDDISIFRIFVQGNLNSNDKLHIELKDLR